MSCPRTRSGSTTWWRPPAGRTRNWPAPARAPSGPATRIRTRSQPKTTGTTRTTRTPESVPGKQRDPGRPAPWESGLVIVDKPGGMTSHDVVARIRRLAHTRRVGHAGTLDPMATGVLVIGVEKATRLLGHLMLTEKAYDATVRLGQASSTDDAEGELGPVLDTSGLGEDAVRAALATQVGEILQVPTAVSAIK